MATHAAGPPIASRAQSGVQTAGFGLADVQSVDQRLDGLRPLPRQRALGLETDGQGRMVQRRDPVVRACRPEGRGDGLVRSAPE